MRDPEEIEKCIYRTLNHSKSFETPSYESRCVLRNNLYMKQNNKDKNSNKSTIYTVRKFVLSLYISHVPNGLVSNYYIIIQDKYVRK